MNKAQRELQKRWRDEVKAAVTTARVEEGVRSKEERGQVSKRDFLLQRAEELLSLRDLDGHELEKKKFWTNKFIVGKTPAQHPDAPRIAPRYEAWPAEGEIPPWLSKRFADEHWLWDALAIPVQGVIRDIREQQKRLLKPIYEKAEAEGQDTKSDEVRKKLAPKIRAALKQVDYSPLKDMERARRIVLKEADLIRHGKIADRSAEMTRLEWNLFNWTFAEKVSRLPAWLQRVIETRLNAASKARRTRRDSGADEKWFQGYPKPDPEHSIGEGGLDIYFNGQNLNWVSGEMKNSYLEISPPWDPPDHRGPRTGKYRSHREMRKVTLREPESNASNCFSLNVLFHSVPSGARMKGYKLRAKSDNNGKLRWFFIPTFELSEEAEAAAVSAQQQQRTFAGVDAGWRKSGEGKFAVLHSWDEARGYRLWEAQIDDNRWARRYNARQEKLATDEQFPIRLTPDGLRDFASRRGNLQRDLKGRMSAVLQQAELVPANWERIGKRGMNRMMTDEKSQEFPLLQTIRPDYELWKQRDCELGRLYRVAWDMVSHNLDRQRWMIARGILSGVSDVGIEALDVKQMAEAENEGQTNWERHVENVQDRSRQLTGPASFLTILVSTARKLGKRVHQIDPRYTSRSCSDCGHVNDLGPGQIFTCAGCGRRWNRDENAARNLARLACECSRDDSFPGRCSHDGKSIPFHGISAGRRSARRPKVQENAGALAKLAVASSHDGA